VIDLEVGAALGRLVRAGSVPERRARLALIDLRELPIERAASLPLLQRCWELRENVSFYDAAYVALAELLDIPLLTADARLARASGPRCAIDVVTTN
jgi:predicted nucleic acid-binding protein